MDHYLSWQQQTLLKRYTANDEINIYHECHFQHSIKHLCLTVSLPEYFSLGR